MTKIAASILASDFSNLGQQLKMLEQAEVDWVHIDVMDGHFVPNITIGPPVVKAIRPSTKMTFDVHLMIEKPDRYVDNFIDAGADIISIHAESDCHLQRTLSKIRKSGKKAAVALNPATSLSTIEWVLDDIDMILLMTVNPGFSGQKYIKQMTDKITAARDMVKGRAIGIEVDGGIDLDNVHNVIAAGATVIVSGVTIFNSADMKDTVRRLRG